MFGLHVGGAKAKGYLPLRILIAWSEFLVLPGDAFVFEGLGGRDALAVHNHEALIQVHTYVHIEQTVLPFLVDLILKSKLHTATTHLHRVHE